MSEANTQPRPTVGIIGAGSLGGSLARALQRAGYRVVALSRRNQAAARQLAAELGALAAAPVEVAAQAELVLLTVPDDQIAPLCGQIALAGGWRLGQLVVHCSGALGRAELAAAAALGAHTGGLHPLQTFDGSGTPPPLGSAYALEADEPLLAVLEALVAALGGRALQLRAADRALYHAAAAITSNYTLTLFAQAVQLFGRCGFAPEQAAQALLPLLGGTLASLAARGLPGALTGPLARGDAGTVGRHLAALEAADPQLAALYRQLGLATLPLALAKGGIDQLRAAMLAALLEDNGRVQGRGSLP